MFSLVKLGRVKHRSHSSVFFNKRNTFVAASASFIRYTMFIICEIAKSLPGSVENTQKLQKVIVKSVF